MLADILKLEQSGAAAAAVRPLQKPFVVLSSPGSQFGPDCQG